ncbi:Serine/threonine-protein kinase PDIK1L [Folsomia candida]|uniref:Serine/threonine-protein kinase PDIK1L n=1 Tax=Folsomia candida TaxID=158441 RepID=A0A226EXK0_FOLCA|nr:Serine/threonine-protein kinase PDIK1L [Folsomia candida]
MFSKDGFALPVKIGDFGLSRILDVAESQDCELTSGIGTNIYMAPEAFSNNYSFQADLFSMGLVIFEVIQLIHLNQRKKVFDSLVLDQDESVVAHHPEIPSGKELVIALTKRKVQNRIKTIEEVALLVQQWQFRRICREDSTSHFYKSNRKPAKNSDELYKCLHEATPGTIITLSQGTTYSGKFVLTGKNVSVIGQGKSTVIKNNSDSPALTVLGTGHKISYLKIIHGDKISGSNCFDVAGDGSAFSNITLSGSDDCILVSGNDNKFTKIITIESSNGMHIIGSRNIIEGLEVLSTIYSVIHIASTSTHNRISNVMGNIMRRGIVSNGGHNKFSNITLTAVGNQVRWWHGIVFSKGAEFNHIDNLRFRGCGKALCDIGLLIKSDNSTARDCKCGTVFIGGKNMPINFIVIFHSKVLFAEFI